MKIENKTLFHAEALPLIIPSGETALTIIVKATFEINSGAPAKEQQPIAFGDEFSEEGVVRYESDIIPVKPATDVALFAMAHAPDNLPAECVPVSVSVGPVQKKLMVFGERFWNHKGVLSRNYVKTKAKPFLTKPIVYADAFGGVDPDTGEYCPENLSGKGCYAPKSKTNLAGRPLPGIEDPRHLIRTIKDRPPPTGLGFYGRAWQPRAGYAGTFDDTWRKTRSPKPPEDFNPRFYNGAHSDLQVQGYLRGDEAVELINLTPTGRESFHLPGIRPTCRVHAKTAPEFISMRLDTLFIEPDENRFILVWRGNGPDPAAVTRVEIDVFTMD